MQVEQKTVRNHLKQQFSQVELEIVGNYLKQFFKEKLCSCCTKSVETDARHARSPIYTFTATKIQGCWVRVHVHYKGK